MEKIKTVKGTHDLFDEDSQTYDLVIKVAELICCSFNYQKMTTPIIEKSNVFQKTLGESSDVISKEMYTFLDIGGESITLRPEGTAPITRAIISNSLHERINQRFYYFGPMFRRERPQSGRLRQFHQFGIEIFNDNSFYADAEALLLSTKIIKNLGLENNLKLEINSLGNRKSRDDYKKCLANYFSKYKNDLSKESLIRLKKNVLRILDSKETCDQKLIMGAPKIKDFLDNESKIFYEGLKQTLNNLKISYEENQNLVRGLDYYDHTIFEFVGDTDSRQNTLIAGGRFNGLSEMLGGKNLPGVGWAAGIERISLIIERNRYLKQKKIITIFAASDKNNHIVLEVLNKVSNIKNISFHTLYNGSLKKKMTKANKLNAISTLIIGDEELVNDELIFKDLSSGNQSKVNIGKIKEFILERT